MLGMFARGTLLLFVATMIAVYALSVGKKEPAPAQSEQPVQYLFV